MPLRTGTENTKERQWKGAAKGWNFEELLWNSGHSNKIKIYTRSSEEKKIFTYSRQQKPMIIDVRSSTGILKRIERFSRTCKEKKRWVTEETLIVK